MSGSANTVPEVPASEGIILSEAPWGPTERKGLWPLRRYVRTATFVLEGEKHGVSNEFSIHSQGKRHTTNVDLLGAGEGTGPEGKVLVDIEAWADAEATFDAELRVVHLKAESGGSRIGIYSDLHRSFPALKPKVSVVVKARFPRVSGTFRQLDVSTDEGSISSTDLAIQSNLVKIEARNGSIQLKGANPLSQSLHLVAKIGSVRVEKEAFTEDLVAEVGTGEARLGPVHASAATRIQADTGSVTVASVYSPLAKITSGPGSVNITGEVVAQDLAVHTKVGSISIKRVTPVIFESKEGTQEARVAILSEVGTVQVEFKDDFVRHERDAPARLAQVWSSKLHSKTGSVLATYNPSFAGLVRAVSDVGSVNLFWAHQGTRNWVMDHQRKTPGEAYEGSVFFQENPLNKPDSKYLPAQLEAYSNMGSVNLRF